MNSAVSVSEPALIGRVSRRLAVSMRRRTFAKLGSCELKVGKDDNLFCFILSCSALFYYVLVCSGLLCDVIRKHIRYGLVAYLAKGLIRPFKAF